MIDINEIKSNIKTGLTGKRIIYYDLVDSTNLEAMRLIENSQAQCGDVIVAKAQSSGKGQQNHNWNSPEGGLYVSIISASKVSESSNLITFVSGLSCIDAIRSAANIQPGLKWVNDIIINRKKLGGILTETITRGNISTHISGIGINIESKISNNDNARFKPVSLCELTDGETNINMLIAEICNYFEEYFDIYQKNPELVIKKWTEYSRISGLKVNFLSNHSHISGIAEGIDNFGHLIVDVNGQKHKLTSTQNVEFDYI